MRYWLLAVLVCSLLVVWAMSSVRTVNHGGLGNFVVDPSFTPYEYDQNRIALGVALEAYPELKQILEDKRMLVTIGRTDDIGKLKRDLGFSGGERSSLIVAMEQDGIAVFHIFVQSDCYQKWLSAVGEIAHNIAHVIEYYDNLDEILARKYVLDPKGDEQASYEREVTALSTLFAKPSFRERFIERLGPATGAKLLKKLDGVLEEEKVNRLLQAHEVAP